VEENGDEGINGEENDEVGATDEKEEE